MRNREGVFRGERALFIGLICETSNAPELSDADILKVTFRDALQLHPTSHAADRSLERSIGTV